MPTGASSLAGVRVVITRPGEQADTLATRIAGAGGVAIRFPTIEIVPVAPSPTERALLDRLDQFDLVLFVSVNAVTHGLARVAAADARWSPSVRFGAVGPSTANRLMAAGLHPVLTPRDRFDSEGLLALPELNDIRGKRIAIFRGKGGREKLAEALRHRGARVEYIECYRRTCPRTDPGVFLEAIRPDIRPVVVLTSVDAVRHLQEILALHVERLRGIHAVVASQRIASAMAEMGLGMQAWVATGADDDALLDALRRWRASQKIL